MDEDVFLHSEANLFNDKTVSKIDSIPQEGVYFLCIFRERELIMNKKYIHLNNVIII